MGEEAKKFKLERLTHTDGIQLTENTYNLTIGAVLVWGFLIDFIMARFLTPYIVQVNYIVILIAYFACSMAGIALVFKSRKPAVSLAGFTVLAAGVGLILTFFLTAYTASTIYSPFLMTGIVTVVMMLAGLFFPSFFMSIGRTLMMSLLACIAVELIGGLIFRLPLDFVDYIVVLIFAGYIGYDWARAQAYPRTLDNAIDSAADIYVDIINIFIRILSIMGKKKN
jgi:FtsH-binding integral membrane protein